MAKRKAENEEAIVEEVLTTTEGVAEAITPAVYDPVNDPEGAKAADAYMANLGMEPEPVQHTPEVIQYPNGITATHW